jgi:DNA-binding NtrC family response regulator
MTTSDGQGTTIARPMLDLELPEASFVLSVVAGPDAGATFALDGSGPVRPLAGTSPVCELKLSDRSVSRRHLSLELEGKRLRVRDLGSTNGTFVNGLQIEDARLLGGERITLGATTLALERTGLPKLPAFSAAKGFGPLLGQSLVMRRLYPLLDRLARSDIPVVIEGETGTGKEVLAEALHLHSARAKKPLVVFDCTTVAPSLLESELFGHEKGAFTGATESRKGLFEEAEGGTLLIDEIGDLDTTLQPKLLRVLERGELRRVGGNKVIPVDVRVLAATRRDLDREVQQGRFRDDLFHRLAVSRVELPPLRERGGDIELLAAHFAAELGFAAADVRPEVLERWRTASWPGNIRELRNAVARHLSLGELDAQPQRAVVASIEGLGAKIEALVRDGMPWTHARLKALELFEGAYVQQALQRHGGNVARAAEASGLARRYFQKIKARSR